MADDRQSQAALAQRLREIGYEIVENSSTFIARLDGSSAYISVRKDNVELNDLDVSHEKAERILAILAEPDRPVVPLSTFVPCLSEALENAKIVWISHDAAIRLPLFTLLLTPLPRGDIRINFRPEAEAIDERTLVFAGKHVLKVASDTSDFKAVAVEIDEITKQILDVDRGIEASKKL